MTVGYSTKGVLVKVLNSIIFSTHIKSVVNMCDHTSLLSLSFRLAYPFSTCAFPHVLSRKRECADVLADADLTGGTDLNTFNRHPTSSAALLITSR